MENIELLKLVSQEEDSLFEMIGASLSQEEIGLLPKSRKSLIRIGKNWWENNKVKILSLICKNRASLRLDEAFNKDEVQLILAIADLIAGFIIGVSPFVVASLVIKLGIDRICQ